MRLIARVPPNEYEIDTNDFSQNGTLVLNGRERKASLIRLNDHSSFLLLIDNHSHQITIEEKDKEYVVRVSNRIFPVELENERARRLKNLIKTDNLINKQREIKAPMPGLIVKVNVQEGQEIKKGDGLAIIEAMKMENEIRAVADGRIKKIFKFEKESVEKGQVLMLLE